MSKHRPIIKTKMAMSVIHKVVLLSKSLDVKKNRTQKPKCSRKYKNKKNLLTASEYDVLSDKLFLFPWHININKKIAFRTESVRFGYLNVVLGKYNKPNICIYVIILANSI